MENNKNTRAIALDILMKVFEEDKLSHLVIRDALEDNDLGKQDKAFILRLAEGTIEKTVTLDYQINTFSKVKVNRMKPFIRNLLRMSLYQIEYMGSVPDSAACNEAVKLAKKRGFSNLSSFVNGVLRNISRNLDKIIYPDENKEPDKYLSIRYSVPEWIVKHFIKNYGLKKTISMLKVSDSEIKNLGQNVRVNTSKIDVNEVIDMLKNDNIEVERSKYSDNALVLTKVSRIDDIEAFKKGYIQVQDVSSMLAVESIVIKSSDICMDLCAAPGGKTLYMADILSGTGKVYARDINSYKARLIEDNVKRSGFDNIVVEVMDATMEDEKMFGKADVVLADVPCSGLGVINTKNDIKYKLKPEDFKELAKISRKILSTAVKYLKKDGILLFSTCTLSKTENEDVREWLIEQGDVEPISIYENIPKELMEEFDGKECAKNGYINILLSEEMDGFFISKYRKK